MRDNGGQTVVFGSGKGGTRWLREKKGKRGEEGGGLRAMSTYLLVQGCVFGAVFFRLARASGCACEHYFPYSKRRAGGKTHFAAS